MSNEIYTCIMQGEIPIEPTPDKRRHELVVFSKADSILCRVCSVGIFPLFLGFPCSSEMPHAVLSVVKCLSQWCNFKIPHVLVFVNCVPLKKCQNHLIQHLFEKFCNNFIVLQACFSS